MYLAVSVPKSMFTFMNMGIGIDMGKDMYTDMDTNTDTDTDKDTEWGTDFYERKNFISDFGLP
jgi:hypothetical protein